MLTFRRVGAGGSPRGRPRLALLALALLALGGEGCTMMQSMGIGDGCSKCGLRRPRIMRRRDPGCTNCGEGGGTVIEGAAPAVVAPGTVVSPGTVVTPGSAGAPADAGAIPDLAPADEPPPGGSSRSSGSSPAGAGTGATATKSNYQTFRRARPRPSEGAGLARALPPLEPTPRSAPGGGVTLSDNLLDNLPTPEALESPPRATEPDAAPAAVVAPVAPAQASPGPPAAEPANPPVAPPEAQAEAAPASVAIGIAHFKVVDAQLAGGSFPTAGGWAWLAEKSYRTVLDLREPEQFHPEDLATITHQGLRYVALPVAVKGINADLLKRFDRELAQADARPLYFCDADGTRPATLWYLRRVSVDKFDRPTALREARGLGALYGPFLSAADAYLDSLNPPQAASAAAASVAPKPAAVAVPASAPEPTVETAPAPPPGSVSAVDAGSWQPFVALALTALGVPVAYWGRSAFSFRSIRRASLPGPGPRPKALPPSSDV